MSRFRRFAFWFLGYNVATVLWGALVRASGSGAGCGSHWPLCNGAVVPRSPALETVIEYTHRVLSGVDLVLGVVLVVWAFRTLPRGHVARKAAAAAGGFLLLEALAGAALVLLGWVSGDASAGRGGAVVVHLAITFLLVGAITLTAALADRPSGLVFRGRGPLVAALSLGVGTLLVAGATGAVAALGDTLFPAASLAQGFAQELGDQAPFLLRLRLVHPFAALASTLVLVVVARAVLQTGDARLRGPALRLVFLLGFQLAAGTLNWWLLAPIWMQLVHLLLADLTWIALVWLAAEALSGTREEASEQAAGAVPSA
jgi:cytochrome c oxidase assembly protein subunit 15